MKKYFIFAAVAAAGLLTSCSSSDDAISETQGNPIESLADDQVPIQIGVGTPSSVETTRGTGSAGSTEAEAKNIWRGERVHVLMYQVKEDESLGLLPTFNYTLANNSTTEAIYDDQSLLVTPLEAENKEAGIAKEPTNPAEVGWNDPQYTYKIKYYPINGISDFWGYYLGGYGTTENDPDAAAGDGAVTLYTNENLETSTTTETEANVAATGFHIDGTHDLLVGQAKVAGTWTPAQDGSQFAYSAKAARKELQPNIIFKHLLTRLKFQAIAGNAKGAGVRVTGIKVRSKDTGKMIVAYKYKDANGTAVDEPENRIVWSAAQEEMSYNGVATVATWAWVPSDADAYTQATDQQDLSGTLGADVNAADAIEANEGRVAKLWLVDSDADSEMDANEVTYKKVVKTGEARTGGLPQLSLKRRITAANIAAEAYQAASGAWVAATADEYAAAVTANKSQDKTATVGTDVDAADATEANDGLVAKLWLVDTDNDSEMDANEVTYKKVVWTPASGLQATDENKMLPLAPIALTYLDSDNDNKNDVTELKPIGEALLVAPQEKYDIEVNYEMDVNTAKKWYAANSSPWAPGDEVDTGDKIQGTLHTDLIRTGQVTGTGDDGTKFLAGNSYLITITLYGPEEIVVTTTLTAWTQGDQNITIGED